MVLEDMLEALEPIGCYDTSAPHLRAEIRVYAEEIERLYAELDSIIDERFIATAGDEGLSAYEEMFGPAMTGETAADRRERLRLRFGLGEGDFTPSGVRRALDSFGFEYTMSEFPSQDCLDIVATADYSAARQSFISREIGKIMPSHTEYRLTFNTMTWDQLDARGKTFTSLDNDNMTWAQIDSIVQS